MALEKAGNQEAKHTGLTGFVALYNKAVDEVNERVIEQGAPAAITDGDTAITAANLQARILTMESSTSGRAPTVPTGTAINGIIDVGDSIDWSFINTGDQDVTVSAANDHTLVGHMVIGENTQGMFRTRCSAENTAISYRLA